MSYDIETRAARCHDRPPVRNIALLDILRAQFAAVSTDHPLVRALVRRIGTGQNSGQELGDSAMAAIRNRFTVPMRTAIWAGPALAALMFALLMQAVDDVRPD